jgi:spore coat protein U-like protein
MAVPPEAIGMCSFFSTIDVNFGAYNVFIPTPTDSTGSITYTCTPMFTTTINLSKGSAPSYFPRQMRKGGESLFYNLYRDAQRVLVWGDGTGGASRYGPVLPPAGSRVTVTIYGRIPAGQDVSAGFYTDTITATINF